MTFDMQISIDGPEWLTDAGRGKDVTKRILANLEIIKDFLKGAELGNCTLDLKYKATVSLENMEILNNDKELFEEWYMFSYQLTQTFKDINNKNFKHPSFSLASLVVPGMYTSEDGKIFSTFVKNNREFMKKIIKEKLMPEFKNMHTLNAYTYRFKRMMDTIDGYIMEQPYNATCSGFDTQSLVDKDGDVMACHRLVLFNDDEFTDSIQQDTKYSEDWDVSKLAKDIIANMKKHFIPNIHISPQIAFDKYNYVSRATHEFMQFRISTTVTLIRELALAGQVLTTYENLDAARLLAIYINTANSCPVENYLNTGSWQLNLVSMIRIFGNGVFQNLMEEYMEISHLLGGLKYDL